MKLFSPGQRVLIYGYGNPGRNDDGLGIAFTGLIQEWIEGRQIGHVETDCNYQLNIEDAMQIAGYDVVLFVDATKEEIEGHALSEVFPQADATFTTHSASPQYILYLCQQMYGSCPRTWLLHLKGYEWEFTEQLSTRALDNLQSAFTFITKELLEDFTPGNSILSTPKTIQP